MDGARVRHRDGHRLRAPVTDRPRGADRPLRTVRRQCGTVNGAPSEGPSRVSALPRRRAGHVTLLDLELDDRGGVQDQAQLKRRLQAMHSERRNRGLNPVEALAEIADELLQGEATDARAHLVATAFQQFISDDARAGFGQYLTPQIVAAHLAELVREYVGTGPIMDPFVGSGILLDAVGELKPDTATVGVEVNRAVANVARASMTLAGRDFRLIEGDAFGTWLSGGLPKASCIVMNPPFGAQVTDLSDAEIGRTRTAKWLGTKGAVPVELLALELCVDQLEPGGVVAAVLPQSVLTNNKWSNFRAGFFTEYKLLHATALPSATFSPFRGVARAHVLLIQNVRPSSLEEPFTYAESMSVGYDATGRATNDEDLSTLLTRPRGPEAASFDQKGHLVRARAETVGDTVRLGDIADVFRGRNPGRDNYAEEGPFLLKVGGLSGSFISWREKGRNLVPRDWWAKSPKTQLRYGDICFTATAHRPDYIGLKVDMVSQVPAEGAVASGEVIVVRLNDDAPFSPIAMLYYLRSAAGYAQLQSRIRGSTAHLYPKDLVDMEVPDLDVQFNVADITRLHAEAEAAFRTYLHLEDRISELVALPAVYED